MMVYVHQVLCEVQVKNERVDLININQKILLILYVNELFDNWSIYLFYKQDIEGISSPAVLRKAASTNATNLIPHKPHYHSSSDHDQQSLLNDNLSIFLYSCSLDQNPSKTDSTNVNDMIDIDERLKSLEKFMKENLPS